MRRALVTLFLIFPCSRAQAPALDYSQARSGLLRLRSPLSIEQRAAVAIVMATSYTCGKWAGKGSPVPSSGSATLVGTSLTQGDCDDVVLTIKSSAGTLVK
jgi:hypothetical protein